MAVTVGVGVAVRELRAEGDGELDRVGSALGVAGGVTVEEGDGEFEGTGVPLAAPGWLVSDVDTSTDVAGGGAAASATPAAIAAMPPSAPSPSNTGVQDEP